MNLSGPAVAAAARFYGLEPADILVVHDEIDLELGDVRAKMGGGLAGHNGLRSVRGGARHEQTSRASASASGGRAAASAGRSPTGCSSRSIRAPTSTALVERGAACALAVARDGVDAAMREFNGAGPAAPASRRRDLLRSSR